MQQSFDERNRDLIIHVGGELLHRDQAKVSVFDSLVQGGDGCWEGLRLYDGRIFKLDEHLERLRHSALSLAFDHIPDPDSIKQHIRATLEANGMRDGVHIRLTLSRGTKVTSGMDPRLNQAGSTLIVLAEYKPPVYDKAGLNLASSSLRRFTSDTLDPKIHSNNLLQSILAKIEANAAGADDALMLDTRGFVAETNATHVFRVADGVVETSRTVACPEGVTRATVLEICAAEGIPCQVRDLSQVELYRADEVFCTGTMGELAAVTRIDGRSIGKGQPGPMTARLTQCYRLRTDSEGDAIV
ncbi:MAG: branched-chain amino acid aminotransferase [Planctomycetota bacterium]|jgi:branched-chain amino acid aminotransferase